MWFCSAKKTQLLSEILFSCRKRLWFFHPIVNWRNLINEINCTFYGSHYRVLTLGFFHILYNLYNSSSSSLVFYKITNSPSFKSVPCMQSLHEAWSCIQWHFKTSLAAGFNPGHKHQRSVHTFLPKCVRVYQCTLMDSKNWQHAWNYLLGFVNLLTKQDSNVLQVLVSCVAGVPYLPQKCFRVL